MKKGSMPRPTQTEPVLCPKHGCRMWVLDHTTLCPICRDEKLDAEAEAAWENHRIEQHKAKYEYGEPVLE